MGFGHLKQLEVGEKTARFTLPIIEGVLILKPATEANKPYFNKVLKSSRQRNLRIARTKTVDADALVEGRENDRELFPLYVVVGWEKVTDESGKIVEFSIEECQSFFEQLPDWMLDEIRHFASDVSNFIDIMDVEEKIKN